MIITEERREIQHEAVEQIFDKYEKIDELTYHEHGKEIAIALLGVRVVEEYLKHGEKERGEVF